MSFVVGTTPYVLGINTPNPVGNDEAFVPFDASLGPRVLRTFLMSVQGLYILKQVHIGRDVSSRDRLAIMETLDPFLSSSVEIIIPPLTRQIMVMCADSQTPLPKSENLARQLFPDDLLSFDLIGVKNVILESKIGSENWWERLVEKHPELGQRTYDLVIEESCPAHTPISFSPLTLEWFRVMVSVLHPEGYVAVMGNPTYAQTPNPNLYVELSRLKERSITAIRKWDLIPASAIIDLYQTIKHIPDMPRPTRGLG